MPADSESCDLLRAIARSADAGEIHRLAARVRDWDLLLNLAQGHRVLTLVFARVADMGSVIPEATQERLRDEYHLNVFHSLANAAELIAVLSAFDAEKIPAMPFKGVALAASVYGDVAMRPAGDLDVLIRYSDLTRATALLLKRGYDLQTAVHADGTPVIADCYEYHFERQTDGMVIELRWRLDLIYGKYRRSLGMDWVWPRRRTAMLAGAEVPDMNPEMKLLMLCMHGTKHVWSRLIWICDVAQLLSVSPDLNWNEAIGEARKSGLWRAFSLGVLLANRMAGARLPQQILRRFESDATAFNLAKHVEETLFAEPGRIPEGTVPYNLQILGFRDRARFFLSLGFLRPNERDMAAFPLPKPLYPLYYLVRPFRLLFDRSARL